MKREGGFELLREAAQFLYLDLPVRKKGLKLIRMKQWVAKVKGKMDQVRLRKGARNIKLLAAPLDALNRWVELKAVAEPG